MSKVDYTEAELEFIKALEELTIKQDPEIEYRIHYENDRITMLTMYDHPENTKYIVVDEDTYQNYLLYKIVDGNLVKIVNNPGYVTQLQKSSSGVNVVKNHAGLVLNPNEQYKETEYYAFRDN